MIFKHCSQIPLLAGFFISLLAATTYSADKNIAEQASQLLEQRCMVCHGCYDAPCQLKLEAHIGLQRGASKDLVYDGARLRVANLTRLFDDGFTEQQWRDKGFYPVMDKKTPEQGVMHRMLALKQANPLPTQGALPDGFDFSLYRDQQCPKQSEFDKFEKDHPLWGMPYGLPGLQPEQHQTMLRWLEQGAPSPAEIPLLHTTQQALDQWEIFLNGQSDKQKLMSRYLFEHLFLAAIYFEEKGRPVWFRLIRSSSKPGQDIRLITSRRPYDDPNTPVFYYRLQRMPVTVLNKRHMPYLFNQTRINLYTKLFLTPEYEVTQLPGYGKKIASNPFIAFQQIPVDSRYRFLLEEAQFSIMNFIKGPVCRGQVALGVIEERFWVMFINPDSLQPEFDGEFLDRESKNLRLPSDSISTVLDLFSWRKYAKSEARYKTAKAQFLKEQSAGQRHLLNMDAIWDGDGKNDNAALTVFRHFDTASVVKGFVGDIPKTTWVIDYPLLERIHYLLVAGFDVYGTVAHQLTSRLYMDFLRMDGEFNFLIFMPPKARVELRDYWYRDARFASKEAFFGDEGIANQAIAINYKTDDPKTEFLTIMRERIYGAKAVDYDYHPGASPAMVEAFNKLERSVGRHNMFMPDVSFVNVIGPGRDQVFTLLRNTGYLNIAQLFQEQKSMIPEETSLTVARGFIGAYPNYFFQIPESRIEQFSRDIMAMSDEADYKALAKNYGVYRNAPWFWSISDKFYDMQKTHDPINAGLMDYNRYQAY